MPDMEKVIKDLQDAVNDDWLWRHADYYALTMERAIALLKEQNQRIWELLCEQDKLRDMLKEHEKRIEDLQDIIAILEGR